MSNFIYNVSKGTVASRVKGVKDGSPAGSCLKVVLLAFANLEAQSILEDCDTLADILAGATNEATNTGYARVTITASDLSGMTYAPDDTANNYPVDMPDPTWNGVQDTGTGTIGAFVICWAPTEASADNAIVPMTNHTFYVEPDGSDITGQIATGGFYAAS